MWWFRSFLLKKPYQYPCCGTLLHLEHHLGSIKFTSVIFWLTYSCPFYIDRKSIMRITTIMTEPQSRLAIQRKLRSIPIIHSGIAVNLSWRIIKTKGLGFNYKARWLRKIFFSICKKDHALYDYSPFCRSSCPLTIFEPNFTDNYRLVSLPLRVSPVGLTAF